MSGLVAGIDAGATRTRVALLDSDGSVRGRAEGPSAAAGPGRAEEVADVLERVLQEALAQTGISRPLDALWAGVAGAGREPIRTEVEAALKRRGLAPRVGVGTDTEAAFHAAFPRGPGVLVVAGTGSMALGRAEDGRTARVGGWGVEIGDEGSGYWVGVEAIRTVLRSHDRREAPTALTGAVLRATGQTTPADLVGWRAGASKADVAGLVPEVLAAADAGDAAAKEILDHAAAELALMVRALSERLGPWEVAPPVAATGGLVDPGAGLRERLVAAVEELGVTLSAKPVDAALGAGRLASELSGG